MLRSQVRVDVRLPVEPHRDASLEVAVPEPRVESIGAEALGAPLGMGRQRERFRRQRGEAGGWSEYRRQVRPFEAHVEVASRERRRHAEGSRDLGVRRADRNLGGLETKAVLAAQDPSARTQRPRGERRADRLRQHRGVGGFGLEPEVRAEEPRSEAERAFGAELHAADLRPRVPELDARRHAPHAARDGERRGRDPRRGRGAGRREEPPERGEVRPARLYGDVERRDVGEAPSAPSSVDAVRAHLGGEAVDPIHTAIDAETTRDDERIGRELRGHPPRREVGESGAAHAALERRALERRRCTQTPAGRPGQAADAGFDAVELVRRGIHPHVPRDVESLGGKAAESDE